MSGALTIAALVAAAYFFWPASLGGCSTLTIVTGHSMEPTYYTGDLVWARCGEPQINDVIVYEPNDIDGARVIHRIIDESSGGWTMKGDNNEFLDPWTPDDSDIVGIARAHIPWLGNVILAFGSPYVWVSLLVLAAGLLVWPQSRPKARTIDETSVVPADQAVSARVPESV